MNCPQCGYQEVASEGPCSRCGFTPRPSDRPEHMTSFGAFQAPTAYPGIRFSSQQEARGPGAETKRGETIFKSSSRNLSSPTSSEPVSTTRPGFHSLQPLSPGTVLRSGRYRLKERLGQQNWSSGGFEASWLGEDFRHGGTPVLIYEVIIPDAHSSAARAMLRTSAYALLAAGRHPCIPTLQDVFNDQDRAFFVFEPFKGESLQARLQHLGHPVSEQEVITFCVQMTEILEVLASQSPSLIHGRIDPEHIYLFYDGSGCTLSNLSPIMATGVKQFILEAVQTRNSSYTAPEFAQSLFDARSDLYSLIATAYYAVTGRAPTVSGGTVLHAQQFNAAISSDFDAVLAKGLHPVPQQRYQRAAEFRQDLLAIRSRVVSGNLVTRKSVSDSAFSAGKNTEFSFVSRTKAPGSAYPFPIPPNPLGGNEADDEESVLLPSPEMLPPMREEKGLLEAAVILAVIFLSLGIVTVLSNFHV